MRIIPILCLFFASSVLAETIIKPTLIVSDDPFTSGSSVEMAETDLFSKVEIDKTETGTLNGVRYKFWYTDGSGTFAGAPTNRADFNDALYSNWDVQCKKDPINDRKMCQMRMRDLWIYVFADGKRIVSIGSDHFPKSTVSIRIDGKTPYTTTSNRDGNFPLDTSLKIIEALKASKTVTTRFMKWPYRSWVDSSWDTYGFNECYQYINWAVKHIK